MFELWYAIVALMFAIKTAPITTAALAGARLRKTALAAYCPVPQHSSPNARRCWPNWGVDGRPSTTSSRHA